METWKKEMVEKAYMDKRAVSAGFCKIMTVSAGSVEVKWV